MRAETRSGALGTIAVLAMQVMTADHLWVYIGVLVVSPIGMGLADPVFLRALSLSLPTYLPTCLPTYLPTYRRFRV